MEENKPKREDYKFVAINGYSCNDCDIKEYCDKNFRLKDFQKDFFDLCTHSGINKIFKLKQTTPCHE